MRSRTLLILGLITAVALAGSVFAAPTGPKATGGGQIIADSTGGGPGDTIAFVAQFVGNGAVKGQVQYIDREDDGTKAIFHGTVACVSVYPDGDTANIAGTWDRPEGGNQFEIFARDNGEGGDNVDQIIVNEMADDPECGDEDEPDDDDFEALGRGNIQVWP